MSPDQRLERLEALATAVREGLRGLPDHPWIPGATAGPVLEALLALDAPEQAPVRRQPTPEQAARIVTAWEDTTATVKEIAAREGLHRDVITDVIQNAKP